MDARHLRYVFGEDIEIPTLGPREKTDWEVRLKSGMKGKGADFSRFLHRAPVFATAKECKEFESQLGAPLVTGPGDSDEFRQSVSTFTAWEQIETLVLPALRQNPARAGSAAPALDGDEAWDRALSGNVAQRLSLPLFATLDHDATMRTLKYMFFHMKCGILVSIRNGKLAIFCPFANAEFRNNWTVIETPENQTNANTAMLVSREVQAQLKKHHSRKEVVSLTGRAKASAGNPYARKENWWANGNIIDNIPQAGEWGDHYLLELHELVSECCAAGEIGDCDFFINKRDYPQLKFREAPRPALLEPYGFVFNRDDRDPGSQLPLSPRPDGPFRYEEGQCFAPVLSFYSSTERFADIMIPPVEDYVIARQAVFASFKRRGDVGAPFAPPSAPKLGFLKRACFRGTATGGGTRVDTNQRLHLAMLGEMERQSRPGGAKLLDAKLTGHNLRHKKIGDEPLAMLNLFAPEILHCPRPDGNPLWTHKVPKTEETKSWDAWYFSSLFQTKVANMNQSINMKEHYLTTEQQMEYRYNIYVEGHCAANRFGRLMAMGTVILRVRSRCAAEELWFFKMLEENKHFIYIDEDLGNLFDVIEKYNADDAECERIARETRAFYDKYLSRDALLKYTSFVLRSIAHKTAAPAEGAAEAEPPAEPRARLAPRQEFGVSAPGAPAAPDGEDFVRKARECLKRDRGAEEEEPAKKKKRKETGGEEEPKKERKKSSRAPKS